MITKEQEVRLQRVLVDAAKMANQALIAFGGTAQVQRCVEECAELTSAIMHRERGVGVDQDVVDEAADVILTALAAGLVFSGAADYGPNDLIDAIAHKTQRLGGIIESEKRK